MGCVACQCDQHWGCNLPPIHVISSETAFTLVPVDITARGLCCVPTRLTNGL
uniref:Uncharacterized protein n=1 Tax=Lepeophtheirus salmonis TaxID=72036 RepID=A0A0K2TNF3_LEPSM